MMENQLKVSFKRVNYLVISIITLLGLTLSACGLAKGELSVGDPAPGFTLPSEAGEQVSLADYQGKQPVLLYFHMAVG
jgi:hypothetical protein